MVGRGDDTVARVGRAPVSSGVTTAGHQLTFESPIPWVSREHSYLTHRLPSPARAMLCNAPAAIPTMLVSPGTQMGMVRQVQHRIRQPTPLVRASTADVARREGWSGCVRCSAPTGSRPRCDCRGPSDHHSRQPSQADLPRAGDRIDGAARAGLVAALSAGANRTGAAAVDSSRVAATTMVRSRHNPRKRPGTRLGGSPRDTWVIPPRPHIPNDRSRLTLALVLDRPAGQWCPKRFEVYSGQKMAATRRSLRICLICGAATGIWSRRGHDARARRAG
jgi:hypothetical protein